jgi:hypothetical protein|tara:strand:- start:840 stop:1163 length:324 start_codon:yes stop_codon:yes gene_type:complete
MKDKRTYKNIKEYGEDMSHENERKHTNEDRGPLDLSFVIEEHQKEIWEWKKRESEFIQTKNLLEGARRIITEMSSSMRQLENIIKNLRHDKEVYKKEIEKLLAEKTK